MTEDSVTAIHAKLLSRSKAIELGLKRYFTGKPCKRGHISERYVSDKHCAVCNHLKNLKNQEYHTEYHRKWRENNHNYKNNQRQWLLKQHPGYSAEKLAKFKANNPNAIRVYWQRRRVRESSGELSVGLADKLMSLQRQKCACCKRRIDKSFHMDHIEPLSKGGLNVDRNIQLLCPSCNLSKNAKHSIDFMQERGFLL